MRRDNPYRIRKHEGIDGGFEALIVVIFIAVGWSLFSDFSPFASTACGYRSKVSRAKADQRSLATAIESYYVDHNVYPAMRPLIETAAMPEALRKIGGGNLAAVEWGRGDALHGLTTPIPYLSSMFPDPYSAKDVDYAYYVSPDSVGWIVYSAGPDGDYDILDPAAVYDSRAERIPSEGLIDVTYDPTNGIESNGDIYRLKQ